MKKFTAHKADALSAHVVRSAPLTYDDDPDPDVDRPEQVRAASSLVYLLDRFAREEQPST